MAQSHSQPPQDAHSEIDHLCTKLRIALAAGQPSPIEVLVNEAPSAIRGKALEELVAKEAQVRASQGEQPEWLEYAEGFPGELEAAWRGFRHYDPQEPRPEGVTCSAAVSDENAVKSQVSPITMFLEA